jgi:hypothetical protein
MRRFSVCVDADLNVSYLGAKRSPYCRKTITRLLRTETVCDDQVNVHWTIVKLSHTPARLRAGFSFSNLYVINSI